jgi:hypothetical protein
MLEAAVARGCSILHTLAFCLGFGVIIDAWYCSGGGVILLGSWQDFAAGGEK